MTHPLLECQLRSLLGLSDAHELAAFCQYLEGVASGAGVDAKHAAALRGLKPLLNAVVGSYREKDQDLKTSDARLRELIEISSEWYWEQDEQYRFTVIADGVAEVVGRGVSHFIGKTRPEAFGLDSLSPFWRDHARMLDAHAPFREFEFSYTSKDGQLVYVSVSGAPVFDANRRFTGYRGIARNITTRKLAEKQLQETQRFTELLLDSLPHPVTVKDREHRFVRINAAHVREFCTDRAAMLGKTVLVTVGQTAQSVRDIERQLIAKPGVRAFSQTRRSKDGEERHFVVTKATICDEQGEVTGFITTHADVTDIKVAEARVEEQLRLTSVILETAPTPMMVKDGRRQITFVNAAYEKLFGVRRDAILSRERRADYKNEMTAYIEKIEKELLANPGTREFELTLPAASGREVFCIITKSTYLDAVGGPGGIVTTYGDISALKVAERIASEQLRLTTSLLDASPAPTVVKDRSLRLTRCNTAYEKLFEVSRSDILYRPLAAHRSEFAAEVEKTERNLLANSGTHQLERVIVTPSGRRIHCIITKSTYSDEAGAVSGIITTFTDISALKRTEENLIAAKQAAEAAMRARSQFLANMSHEIRTPMNGVLGMSSLLHATPLNSEQREFLDTLILSGEALLKIINDILDFSKIEAGKVEIEHTAFDVRSRVTAITQLFAASARERNLRVTSDISADVPFVVIGDPVRIGQVLSNVVANAIKFTPAGSVHLAVSVAARRDDGLSLRFDISDTGIGIDKDAIDRIFQPFSQADVGTTRRFGGTGLGLSISRELVGLMGGELQVESTPGRGSRFTFTVVVKAGDMMHPNEGIRSAAAEGDVQRVRERGAQLEVLLAEDNAVNQMVATRMLEKLGCKVTVAPDGVVAVDMTSKRPFDLILMDCHMPNMDGFAATAAIRAMEKTQAGVRSVIIAQTANAMEGDRETCLAASMDDYITKPYSLETLARVIKRWAPVAGA